MTGNALLRRVSDVEDRSFLRSLNVSYDDVISGSNHFNHVFRCGLLALCQSKCVGRNGLLRLQQIRDNGGGGAGGGGYKKKISLRKGSTFRDAKILEEFLGIDV